MSATSTGRQAGPDKHPARYKLVANVSGQSSLGDTLPPVCPADFGLARAYGIPLKPMTPKVVTLW